MELELYTDGACVPNPGKGSWAWLLKYEDLEHFDSGVEKEKTTNNRMEMIAIAEGLKFCEKNFPDHQNTHITVYSDSELAVNIFSKWMYNWRRLGGWDHKKKNTDIVDIVFKLMSTIHVDFVHIYGHSGLEENERCDEMCMIALGYDPIWVKKQRTICGGKDSWIDNLNKGPNLWTKTRLN